MNHFKYLLLPVIGVLIIVVGVAGLMLRSDPLPATPNNDSVNRSQVNSFEECVKAGYPVLEIYPEQCNASDGRSFTRQVVAREPITVRGEFVCLPHKNTEGGVTMECAFGLMNDEGIYYALLDTDPEYKNTTSISIGDYVEIKGMFIRRNDSIYQGIGTIEVKSVTVL